MITITGLNVGIANVRTLFGATEAAVRSGVVAGMRRGVQGGAGLVKANAQGRPGPRTHGPAGGGYLGSWNGQVEVSAGVVRGQIGTDKPYGPRLEYGFTGVDSLGREYDQPAYPHILPAVPAIERLIFQEIVDEVQAAVN